ncbi:MAG: hypothetical protein H6717_40605 [Polyangiaceae bacterium]|nr:hypothetical protein [Polyangiaceae bacterium]
MRKLTVALGLTVLGMLAACGGSTEKVDLDGGSGGSANGGNTGGAGNVGGSGNAGGNMGGTGNMAGMGNMAGTGNVGGSMGGMGNMGGSGNAGGCSSTGCGPSGALCCEPGMGCASASGGGSSISCTCTDALVWDCSTGSGGSGGTAGGTGNCGPTGCPLGTTCCNDQCVNLMNDPHNCGTCGNVCGVAPQYCSGGVCGKPPCFGQPPSAGFCCGTHVCTDAQLCCDVQGPGPSMGPICFTPTPNQKTCPIGCPLCQ